ncbi:hypothetical protein BRADI_2g43082v3 [Brachypodium distachyon]|uniref:Uncharacterized protein n=1 Tax=Brachypodium distachyon TaxID=15368 RepID=A0A2K2DDK5_BRADI|nr:hypothetical protein BRADI_2g43082v3 [Brachypodium distachyon]PNT72365.1 hypothetical protein BRADI_2g43082v3 [Brachypodium distachyon]
MTPAATPSPPSRLTAAPPPASPRPPPPSRRHRTPQWVVPIPATGEALGAYPIHLGAGANPSRTDHAAHGRSSSSHPAPDQRKRGPAATTGLEGGSDWTTGGGASPASKFFPSPPSHMEPATRR